MLLAISAAVFSTIAGIYPRICQTQGGADSISGNIAASYYLGSMLDNAGVKDETTQLQIVSAAACFWGLFWGLF
jgi:hypothetical protein